MARLYHVPLSPFCRKVRLVLAEKKIEAELVEERYWENDADFLRRNPAGKVPVLRLDNQIMAESAAICEYIEETRPEPPLMPRKPSARYEVRRLIGWFDDKFHDEVTSQLLYERVNKKITKRGYPGRPGDWIPASGALRRSGFLIGCRGWGLCPRPRGARTPPRYLGTKEDG